MFRVEFSRFGLVLAAACCVLAARAQVVIGPTNLPVAMSGIYNPLLWQGDDAQFALDMLHSAHCTSEISKTVAVKTSNQAVQNVALTMAREQGKIYRQLRGMARTFNFPLPSKDDLNDCPSTARIAELTGVQMDTSYVELLRKSTVANTSRFEAEVAMPRRPSNWSLWKFAQRDLPMMRSEEAAVQHVQVQTFNEKK
ncbi:MAG: DUF4142 domain-containing protein [Acidobacteriaceae bacterium]|nr:DUF4142 domain-containing protein [Acidobacteriaceae bacterium]